ncbi:MAG: hypothetical protein V1914_04465 [archaeon]
MIVKLFGLGDLVAAVSLVLLNLDVGGFAVYLAIASAVYLILKGLIFFFDLASFLDILSAVMIVLALFGFRSMWLYVFAAWLLQKAVRSYL